MSDGLDPDDFEFADSDEEARELPHGVRFGEGQKRGGGRPPGSPNRATIIKRVANKRHKVRLNGKVRSVTTLHLVLRMIATQASNGNIKAFDLQERIKATFAPTLRQQRRPTILFIPSQMTIEEFEAVWGIPRVPMEEVLARFPYLKHAINDRGCDPEEHSNL